MKNIFHLFVIVGTLFFGSISWAATTLKPGDLVILTVNSQSTYGNIINNNAFDFVTKVDLDPGTVIYFADKGWDASLATPFWRNTTGEGTLRYTVPAGGITAGTIIHYDDTLSAHPLPTSGSSTWDMYSINPTTGAMALTTTITNGFDPSQSGDNILVFQDPTNSNSAATPNFIYGIGWAGATTWITSGSPTATNSYLPAGLSLGTTAVSLGSTVNYQYNCSNVNFNSATFLSDIATAGNWSGQGTPQYGISSCSILVDNMSPDITVNQSVSQSDPTSNTSLSFTAVFSEAIDPATLSASDFTLGGTGTGGVVGTPTTSDNITWTVPVTAGTSGTYILSLSASLVADLAGNLNTVSTSTDNTVTVDITAPTLTSFTSSTADNTYGPGSVINVTANISEPVTGGSIMVTLNNGVSVTLSCAPVLPATSTSTCTGSYTVGATGSAQDTGDLTVASYTSTSVVDVAGNAMTSTTLPIAPNNLGDTKALVIDTTAPTLSVTSVGGDTTAPYATNDTTPDVVIVTSVGDTVSITGWTCTPTPATGTSVTCTPSAPLAQGANSVSVSITDSVGNAGTGSVAFMVDSVAPIAPTVVAPDLVNNQYPTITGACETATTVTVTISPTSEVLTTSCAGGTYSVTATTLVPYGPYSATASQTDALSNISPSSSDNGTLYNYGGGGGSTPSTPTTPITPPAPPVVTTPESPKTDEPETTSEETLMCQGPNSVNQWYRMCDMGGDLSSFKAFKNNVVCEKFIIPRETESGYEYTKEAPRKEVLGVAVSMLRNNSNHDEKARDHVFEDVGGVDQSPWVLPTVQVGLYHRLITPKRNNFEPDRSVTRAEAYAMVMSSVCLYPTGPSEDSWQEKLHAVALTEGLTEYSWNQFQAERPILRQELFVLASRAADWAERTGGCTPKPVECR